MLHLHAGPPLEDKGGPRARVCLPRDGGLRARFVLGGAGQDFGRGGRKTRWNYAQSLYEDPSVTLDDLREAVTTLEDTARIARRVLGGAHPTTPIIERSLRNARAKLPSREE